MPDDLPQWNEFQAPTDDAWKVWADHLLPIARKAARLQSGTMLTQEDIEEEAEAALIQLFDTILNRERWIAMAARRRVKDRLRKEYAQQRDRNLQVSLDAMLDETGDWFLADTNASKELTTERLIGFAQLLRKWFKLSEAESLLFVKKKVRREGDADLAREFDRSVATIPSAVSGILRKIHETLEKDPRVAQRIYDDLRYY